MPTHWKKLLNQDYIGAWLLEGKDKILTIKSVTKERVKGSDGKEEELIVAYFAENIKPNKMVLNKTNCKAIQKLHSTPIIEEWVGKKIQLYPTTTKAFGDVVECVRVRPYVNDTKAVAEKCEECDAEIKAVGSMSAESVAQHTLKKYGIKLCSDCATERKKILDGAEDNKVE